MQKDVLEMLGYLIKSGYSLNDIKKFCNVDVDILKHDYMMSDNQKERLHCFFAEIVMMNKNLNFK